MPQGLQVRKIKKRMQHAVGDAEAVRHCFIATKDHSIYLHRGRLTGVFGMLSAPTVAVAITDEAIYLSPMPKGARGLHIDQHRMQRVDLDPAHIEAKWGTFGLKSVAVGDANLVPLEGHSRAAASGVRFIERSGSDQVGPLQRYGNTGTPTHILNQARSRQGQRCVLGTVKVSVR